MCTETLSLRTLKIMPRNLNEIVRSWIRLLLKMPKCEIFDRSDSHDFYTIKSLKEGDFGIKIKKFLKIFRSSFGAAKCLTRMLSLILRSAVPSQHAEHTHKGLMRTLSIRVRNWCIRWEYASGTDVHADCWAYASAPYAYAQLAHQKLNEAWLPQNLK
jgi:hypothetical protein